MCSNSERRIRPDSECDYPSSGLACRFCPDEGTSGSEPNLDFRFRTPVLCKAASFRLYDVLMLCHVAKRSTCD